MSAKITIEQYAGTDIARACEDACRIADILRINVEFTFNDVTCLAQPGGSSAELEQMWSDQVGRKVTMPYDRKFATTTPKSAHVFLRDKAATPPGGGA